MLRRDLSIGLLAASGGALLVSRDAKAQVCTPPCYPVLGRESSAGLTPNTAFACAPVYDVHRLGATGDGATNDYAAIQAAFDLILRDGGVLQFDGSKTYKVNSGLTFMASPGAHAAKPAWINFNNCRLDFSSLSGSAVALKYGATALAHAHEGAPVRVGNVVILGPETNGFPVAYPRPTSTVGVQFENCLHWTIDPHTVLAFYKGMRSMNSWGLLQLNHHVRNCYIGLHLDQLSTYSSWVGCQFLQNSSVGVLARGNDTVSGQSFLSCRFETNSVHVHLDADPGINGSNNPIRGMVFRDCYFESATYDWFRFGMDYDESASPSIRQVTNSQGTVSAVSITGGNWANNGFAPTNGTAAICFDRDGLKNARVMGCQFDIPVSLSQRCRGRPSKSSWRTTRNQFHTGDDLDSFDIGEGFVAFSMTASSVTANRIGGNIHSVTHVSNGIVDVHFHDDYSGVADYDIGGTADNRVITIDTANSSAGRARLVIRDFSGTASFTSNVRIRVGGRHT
jgi:hypothetical protein